jgi:hypothetical protein
MTVALAAVVLAVPLAVVVSDFSNSVSALGDSVAGFTLSSETGAVMLGAAFDTVVVNSATGLSVTAAGVCAPAIAAVSKLKVITVNEATMCTGDLEPSMFTSP